MTSTLDRPVSAQSAARAHRPALVALTLVFLAGVFFIVQAALPYFALDQSEFKGYWPRRWWLLAHITMGIVALLSGPVQLWLGVSDQRPTLHRRLGVVYMLAVVLSAAAGYYLAFNTDFGVIFGAGLAGLATAWLVTTGLAFAAIKRQLYDQHKEWMIRSYVVTTAFVIFRAMFPLLQSSGISDAGAAAALSAWACWALPLLICEAVLQGRKILAVKPA
jgi:uncharacterized membrane protein YozB (DUF420 family)